MPLSILRNNLVFLLTERVWRPSRPSPKSEEWHSCHCQLTFQGLRSRWSSMSTRGTPLVWETLVAFFYLISSLPRPFRTGWRTWTPRKWPRWCVSPFFFLFIYYFNLGKKKRKKQKTKKNKDKFAHQVRLSFHIVAFVSQCSFPPLKGTHKKSLSVRASVRQYLSRRCFSEKKSGRTTADGAGNDGVEANKDEWNKETLK